MTPCTGMSSPTRTTKRSPRSSTRKLALVMPPASGRGATGPDQKRSDRTRSTGRGVVMAGDGSGETPALPRPAAGGADQPVGDDADEGDRQPGDEAAAGIGLGEGDEYFRSAEHTSELQSLM